MYLPTVPIAKHCAFMLLHFRIFSYIFVIFNAKLSLAQNNFIFRASWLGYLHIQNVTIRNSSLHEDVVQKVTVEPRISIKAYDCMLQYCIMYFLSYLKST